MKEINKLLLFVTLTFCFSAVYATAQQTPAYKISNVKIVPFEQTTGKFENEFTTNDERSFFNDLSKGLFVIVEISGKPESYDAKRQLEVTVLEGTKVKLKKVYMSGILNEQGKFYFPLWLDAPMCSEVKITARILGQKPIAATTRKIAFQCGE
jgi:hypothetical protein